MFSCFLIKLAHFPDMNLLTSHLISGIVLKVEPETIVSLSTPFPFHLWSCQVPFQIKTIREINVNWCFKQWVSRRAVLYTYFSFYILLCFTVSVCVCVCPCVHAPTCIYLSMSLNKIDYSQVIKTVRIQSGFLEIVFYGQRTSGHYILSWCLTLSEPLRSFHR